MERNETKMKCVYIAGAIRHLNEAGDMVEFEKMKNIMKAFEWNLFVWQHGGVAICPHTNNIWFPGSLERDAILKGDLELLSRCDAILMVEGWRNSEGSTGERNHAAFLGLPVFDMDFPGYYGAVRESLIEAEKERLRQWLGHENVSVLITGGLINDTGIF
jgi:hypothetical protein